MVVFPKKSAQHTISMASNVNTKPQGRATKNMSSSPNPSMTPPPPPPKSPSVPISLYREVASELQNTRTSLQSLKTQNQELVQKNQQLRLEIERVVQSALHLRQLADVPWMEQDLAPAIATHDMSLAPEAQAGANSLLPTAAPLATHTEQEAKPHGVPAGEAANEISTWWLIMVIGIIILSAFGTGFLIVRPLLPSR